MSPPPSSSGDCSVLVFALISIRYNPLLAGPEATGPPGVGGWPEARHANAGGFGPQATPSTGDVADPPWPPGCDRWPRRLGLPRGDHLGEGQIEKLRIGQHDGEELVSQRSVGLLVIMAGHTATDWPTSAVAEITWESPAGDTAACSSVATVIFRGLACSATGIVSRSTPLL